MYKIILDKSGIHSSFWGPRWISGDSRIVIRERSWTSQDDGMERSWTSQDDNNMKNKMNKMKDKKIMNQQPLVSVVIPVYNAGEYLMESLHSVFHQTYTNIEVIAVNDASKDNSLNILKRVAKVEKRLKIIDLPNNVGPAQAANSGIAIARGDFIARVDSDDRIPVDRIEKQAEFLKANPKVVVVGGQVILMNEYGEFIVEKTFPRTHDKIIDMAFTAMPLQQGAMMVNRTVLPHNFIWYDRKLKTSEDLDFFFRIFLYGTGANLPDIVLFYRQHGASLTQAADPKGIFFQALKVRLKALFDYGIVPGIGALGLSILQTMIVFLMPSFVIYPLYYFWRGFRLQNRNRKGYLPLLKHTLAYLI